MKKKLLIVCPFLLTSLSLASCLNSDSNNENYSDSDFVDCPMCNATGEWTNTMYGTVEECAVCNGTGKADSELAQEMIDFFDKMDKMCSSSTYNGNTDYIQQQIDMCNSEINNMQQILENTNSEVNKAYYSQCIIELQYRVKELENQLR